jgi:hypothetical protein
LFKTIQIFHGITFLSVQIQILLGTLSRNPNITWDIVEANPDIDWKYSMLSCNQMTKHPYYKWSNQLNYVLK